MYQFPFSTSLAKVLVLNFDHKSTASITYTPHILGGLTNFTSDDEASIFITA